MRQNLHLEVFYFGRLNVKHIMHLQFHGHLAELKRRKWISLPIR